MRAQAYPAVIENNPPPVNENNLPLELLPAGYMASVYAPLPSAPGMWGCAIFGPGGSTLGSWFAYGVTPRQAVLNALAVLPAPVPSPVAAPSGSDGVSDVGAGQAVHDASQAPETDCYRQTWLDKFDAPVREVGPPQRIRLPPNVEQTAEIERLRAGIRAMLDGDYPHPRSYRPARCPHDTACFDECGQCNDEYLTELLK
jgi:hypothetical protein